MFKITDVHGSAKTASEYIVLQNQGLMTLSLRGWALCSDTYMLGDPASAAREMYIFHEDIPVKPYGRVVLITGSGDSGWRPTTDGKQAYVQYWGRSAPVWSAVDQVHLLHVAGSRRIGVTEGAVSPSAAGTP